MIEPGGDRDLARQRSGESAPIPPDRRLDGRMQEEQPVPGRRRPSPKVLEERALGPEHLDRARGQSRQAIEAAGVREEAGRQLGPEESREVRSPLRSGGSDGGAQLGADGAERIVQLGELPAGLAQLGVGRAESGAGGGAQRVPRGPLVIAGIDLRSVPGDPTAESLPDQVPDAIEVCRRAHRLLDMDGRVPCGGQSALGLREQGLAPSHSRVRRLQASGQQRGREVEPESVVGEPPIPRSPLRGAPSRQQRDLLGGQLSFPSGASPLRERSRVERRPLRVDDLRGIDQEDPEPGRDHRGSHRFDVPGTGRPCGLNRTARVRTTMDPTPELVRAARIGPSLVLTIDHPPVNVLSRPVLEQLGRRLATAPDDEDVRAVVLTGAAEKAFSAGANIRDMAPMSRAEALDYGGLGQALTRTIERLPLPVIAAVHGVAFGGGCEIALACDFVVASEDAQFAQPEINLGILPGWGGSQRLPARIGPARARRWILTGRPVTAADAAIAGFVDRVVPRSELLPAALALAEELARKPPLALAAAKYAIHRAMYPDIDAGLRYELELWAQLFGSVDQREGMNAFLTRQPPPLLSRRDWVQRSDGFPWARPRVSAATRKRKRPHASRKR